MIIIKGNCNNNNDDNNSSSSSSSNNNNNNGINELNFHQQVQNKTAVTKKEVFYNITEWPSMTTSSSVYT